MREAVGLANLTFTSSLKIELVSGHWKTVRRKEKNPKREISFRFINLRESYRFPRLIIPGVLMIPPSKDIAPSIMHGRALIISTLVL